MENEIEHPKHGLKEAEIKAAVSIRIPIQKFRKNLYKAEEDGEKKATDDVFGILNEVGLNTGGCCGFKEEEKKKISSGCDNEEPARVLDDYLKKMCDGGMKKSLEEI